MAMRPRLPRRGTDCKRVGCRRYRGYAGADVPGGADCALARGVVSRGASAVEGPVAAMAQSSAAANRYVRSRIELSSCSESYTSADPNGNLSALDFTRAGPSEPRVLQRHAGIPEGCSVAGRPPTREHIR